MYTRIIPRLDIKGANLVKGIHLEGLRILGSPEFFANHYYEAGADELLLIDAVASLYGRNNLTDIIEKTAENTFVPLTVAGGLRSLDDIRCVLRAGADKVALNSAAIASPELISEASMKFGASTIAVAIEAKQNRDGSWTAFTDNGREDSRLDVLEWAFTATELGAGEILITSVDRDGTGRGFDINLIRQIVEAVNVPVVASGGAGTIEHVIEVAQQARVQGVCVGSMLHYPIAQSLLEQGHDFGSGGEFKIVGERIADSRFNQVGISDIKHSLLNSAVPCRPPLSLAEQT